MFPAVLVRAHTAPWLWGLGLGLGVYGLGFMVWGLQFRVRGFWFLVSGFWFRDSGLRVSSASRGTPHPAASLPPSVGERVASDFGGFGGLGLFGFIWVYLTFGFIWVYLTWGARSRRRRV